jgi:hypothetical protein
LRLLRGGGDALGTRHRGLGVTMELVEVVATEMHQLDGQPRSEAAHQED